LKSKDDDQDGGGDRDKCLGMYNKYLQVKLESGAKAAPTPFPCTFVHPVPNPAPQAYCGHKMCHFVQDLSTPIRIKGADEGSMDDDDDDEPGGTSIKVDITMNFQGRRKMNAKEREPDEQIPKSAPPIAVIMATTHHRGSQAVSASFLASAADDNSTSDFLAISSSGGESIIIDHLTTAAPTWCVDEKSAPLPQKKSQLLSFTAIKIHICNSTAHPLTSPLVQSASAQVKMRSTLSSSRSASAPPIMTSETPSFANDGYTSTATTDPYHSSTIARPSAHWTSEVPSRKMMMVMLRTAASLNESEPIIQKYNTLTSAFINSTLDVADALLSQKYDKYKENLSMKQTVMQDSEATFPGGGAEPSPKNCHMMGWGPTCRGAYAIPLALLLLAMVQMWLVSW
jgi:hypothetical protein